MKLSLERTSSKMEGETTPGTSSPSSLAARRAQIAENVRKARAAQERAASFEFDPRLLLRHASWLQNVPYLQPDLVGRLPELVDRLTQVRQMTAAVLVINSSPF